MRSALGADAKRKAQKHLRASLAELKEQIGQNPEFSALSAEILRLEVSYG
jgi:hypothetical protein